MAVKVDDLPVEQNVVKKTRYITSLIILHDKARHILYSHVWFEIFKQELFFQI